MVVVEQDQVHKRPSAAQDEDATSSKRQKVTRACDQCKKRKRRCTGDLPCTSCAKEHHECTYLASYTRGRVNDPPANHAVDVRTYMEPGMSSSDASGSGVSFMVQYTGPSSAHSFLKRAWKRFGKADSVSSPVIADAQIKQASIFQYGDRESPEIRPSIASLPQSTRADLLLSYYFQVAAPTYVFLHQPTVKQWMHDFHDHLAGKTNTISTFKPRQAIVMIVMAVAQLYELDTTQAGSHAAHESWYRIESLYLAGKQKLDEDTGRATLACVQARLAMIQYLLSTSRPNQAWYVFGQTVQLMYALGMHRSTVVLGAEYDMIKTESRRRAFWVAYVIDTYLSSMLGRPTLIKDEDIDQDYPVLVDDADLKSDSAVPSLDKDCAMLAVLKHIQLVRIAKRVLRMQSLGSHDINIATYETAMNFNEELRAWQNALPVYLSGAVRPSSLIPLFRRQVSVLKRAHAHATMLINRPFILYDSKVVGNTAVLVDLCLAAAKSCLDLVLEFVHEGSMFSAFWNTHFVTFNALAVIYVWIIQRRIGRLPSSLEVPNELELFDKAERVRGHLSDVTHSCAPTLRYGLVLEELKQEAQLRLGKLPLIQGVEPTAIGDAPREQLRPIQETANSDPFFSSHDFDGFTSDFPTDPNLWLELDNFPFNEVFD